MESLPKESSNNQLATIFLPFKQSRQFTTLFFGQVFSFLGSSITMVILPIIVYKLTNSTAAMGTVMALYMLPNVVMLPFSGIVVDKLNRINIMLTVDIIRFGIMSFLTFLAISDMLNMMSLYIFMFVMGMMDGIFHPAYSSVRAKVFTKEIRTAANSLTQVSLQGVKIFGPTLGGIIITVFSAEIGFGIDALTYLVSFLFLLNLRSITFQPNKLGGNKVSFKKDFLEGIDVVRKHAWLWITILAFSFINICTGGVLRVLIPWLINVHHHLEPYVFGLVLSASGAGAIVCGIVYGMNSEWKKRGVLAYAGVAICGLSLLLSPFISNVPLLMLLMFLNGAGLMLFGLIWEISLQELIPEDKFGRVASLDMLGSLALLPVGYLLTGWLAEAFGGTQTIVLLSSLTIFLSVSVMLHKGIREFE